MSDYGFKISLPGNDVKIALPEACVVHSGYPAPKIDINSGNYKTLKIVFSKNPPNATFTELYSVHHSYTYAPLALATGEVYDPTLILQGTLPISPTATFSLQCVSTSSRVVFGIYWESGWGSIIGYTIYISYYIFAENAN